MKYILSYSRDHKGKVYNRHLRTISNTIHGSSCGGGSTTIYVFQATDNGAVHPGVEVQPERLGVPDGGVSPTISCGAHHGCEPKIAIEMKPTTHKLMNAYNPKFTGGSYAGNVYDPQGVVPALNTMTGGGRMPFILIVNEIKNTTSHSKVTPLGDCRFDIDGREIEFKIRKLTPRECLRLMDVDDNIIDKMMATDDQGKQLISNSQLYKCAGNSIVVNCLYHLFEQIWFPKEPSHIAPKQLTLF